MESLRAHNSNRALTLCNGAVMPLLGRTSISVNILTSTPLTTTSLSPAFHLALEFMALS